MNLKLPPNIFWQLLYVACIAIPYLGNFELTFFFWSLTLVLTVQKKYSFEILKVIIPYIIILIIAFVSHFRYKDTELYFVFRDITYLSKPIIGFLVGYQLFKYNHKFAMNLIVNTAVFIALLHIYTIFSAIVIHHARTVADLRFYSGYFSDYEIYAVLFLLFYKEFGLDYSRKKFLLYTTIVGFSALMYLSRTNFLQVLILYLALKGILAVNRKSIMIFATLFITGIVAYSAVVNSNPRRSAKGFEGLLYKIQVAPLEPFKTQINRKDYKDFNDNYRSYENIQTIRQVSNDGTMAVLFGRGLGSKIDLKQYVYLGDMRLRFISILHNGFMIVFLKSGLVGIFVYLYTIIFFFINRKSNVPMVRMINLLFLGTGIFLFISNWVFLGFYNLTESKSILIGLLIAYRKYLIDNEKHTIPASIS